MEFNDRENACMIWNIMYSTERRPFNELDESTKKEWERFANISKTVFRLNNLPENVKQEIKL